VPERGGKKITLADLATHTSGLPRLPTNLAPKDMSNPYADYTVQQLYDFLSHYELPRDIGAQYEYSNLGAGLLGHALALRAKMSYEALVRARSEYRQGRPLAALALCGELPVTWPNPDVTHGAAGAGLTHLHLWQASGDAGLGRRLLECADGLVASATRGATATDRGVLWTVPDSFDSRFAGTTHYGFAHGLAGIAWFLLAAGLATGRRDCVELAGEAGETLAAAAQVAGGAAWWRARPGDPPGSRLVHWCHGAAGVGTFLARLAHATGEARPRELAELAAVAVRRARWQCSPAACHGLAGNGEFLLDLAVTLEEPRYRTWAEEQAAAILAQHAVHDGRMVVPDDTGAGVAADYGGGLAGVLAFLLRLRHGGPRLWMADVPAGAGAGARR